LDTNGDKIWSKITDLEEEGKKETCLTEKKKIVVYK
jgi:hypothetical protein